VFCALYGKLIELDRVLPSSSSSSSSSPISCPIISLAGLKTDVGVVTTESISSRGILLLFVRTMILAVLVFGGESVCTGEDGRAGAPILAPASSATSGSCCGDNGLDGGNEGVGDGGHDVVGADLGRGGGGSDVIFAGADGAGRGGGGSDC